MSAHVIAVLTQKGGAGKTSVSMLIAGELAERGNRVLVVDADAQGTATLWSKAASDEAPFPAAVVNLSAYAEKLHREVQKQLAAYDYIIVDTPPSVEATAPQSALAIAHLAIVPVPPSPADLWSASGAKALVERARIINDELKVVILVNMMKRTALAKAVLDQLGDFGFPVLNTQLSTLTAYQEAMLSGSTVAALGKSAKPAAEKIKELTDEVLALLGGQK